MLLVVDFSDINLEFDRTDIRIDSSGDFTVGKLLTKVCDGIEEIGHITIPDRQGLMLLSPNRKLLDSGIKVKDLSLNDWDTVYIIRRV